MSSRAPALPPHERRVQLEQAAVQVLLSRGLSATTKEIAAEAGVAEDTIFRVFDSKDDLVHAALHRACDPEPLYARLDAVDMDRPLRPRRRSWPRRPR
ncbi:MAG: helix-turn-helix domain-containing protein [Ornithinimicrobium sp.]|jgi:AcrR family transcriptional regulator|uniref:helix-turn-helix domain-containing protein n=1 Tax=Ornithinimicrobium sp. TaxID=1977084 RepID=UPI003D9B8157